MDHEEGSFSEPHARVSCWELKLCLCLPKDLMLWIGDFVAWKCNILIFFSL